MYQMMKACKLASSKLESDSGSGDAGMAAATDMMIFM